MPSSTNPSPSNLKALALWGSVRGRLTTLGFFVRQDLVQRYQADILGMAWLVLQPLITIALFAVVFSALMRARSCVEASSRRRSKNLSSRQWVRARCSLNSGSYSRTWL